MVTGTDRRMAQTDLPRGKILAGVARSHLSHALCPDAGRLEEGVSRASAAHQRHASFAHYAQKTGTHGGIVDAVPIAERPACIEDRAVPGHWEGDLLFGDAHSQIATLVERHTRYVMLVKLVDKDSYTVAAALARHARSLPQELYRSLTWDRGSEMAGHKRFTLATDIQVYFWDPHHPWQWVPNENTNGLLRQYLPKGLDLSVYSQAGLDAIARQLN